MIRQMVTRELSTLLLLSSLLILTLTLGVHLLGQVRHVPGWRSRDENKIAIGMLFVFVGLAIQRGWAVVLTWQLYHGRSLQDLLDLESRFPVSLLGAGVALIGVACLVRVFTAARWGHTGWMAALLAVGGITLAGAAILHS